MTTFSKLCTISLIVVISSGCVAAVVGTTASVVTVDVLHDRRTLGAYVDDNNIELDVRQYILREPELRRNTHISATSMNGILLLTGEAASSDLRDMVVNYGKQNDAVRQVVNEITIAGKTALISRTNDTWLTAKVKTRLFNDTKLDATRVKVVTERGNVYLMGVVTREEAAAATDVVRNIGGVVRVVKVFGYTT